MSIKIFTSLPDSALINDKNDPTIRQECIVRNNVAVETIDRDLVAEAGDMGPTIKDLVMGHVRSVLGLADDLAPVSVDVIQVSDSGKEYRCKGWMRPDEAVAFT